MARKYFLIGEPCLKLCFFNFCLQIQPDWWVRNHMRPYANKLAEFKKMKLGEIAPLEEDQIAIDEYLRYAFEEKRQKMKAKEKGVNESEEERQYRIERRHRKFGKLAEALAKSVGHPGAPFIVFYMMKL